MRLLRVVLRVPLVFLHFLVAIPLCGFLLGPRAKRTLIKGRPLHDRAVNWWARVFCRILGVRRVVSGEPPQDGRLIVANHPSFLDICVIHCDVAASFIAKGEIRRWPFVGWFSARADTIFHRRGSAESLHRVSDRMRERLEQGRPVALFPEAGTGQLNEIRAFHGRLFQPAIDAGKSVVPLAIDYRQHGKRLNRVAFEQGESFVGAVLRLLGESHIEARLTYLPGLEGSQLGRKDLANAARASIVATLAQQSE